MYRTYGGDVIFSRYIKILSNQKCNMAYLLHTAYQKDIKFFNSLQYNALRAISGINGHVSLQILQTEFQAQPWKIHQHILAIKYIFEPFQLTRQPLIPKLKLFYKT